MNIAALYSGIPAFRHSVIPSFRHSSGRRIKGRDIYAFNVRLLAVFPLFNGFPNNKKHIKGTAVPLQLFRDDLLIPENIFGQARCRY